MADAVDWNLAAALGSRVVGGGPKMTPEEANQVVAELYYLAREATPLVQETTGLDAYLASQVKVVDRSEWIRSNLDSFQRITADPASMSVIRYTPMRPFVVHVNHTGPQLAAALSAPPAAASGAAETAGDATVGGSTD